MDNGITQGMIEAYKAYAKHRDGLGFYGYTGGTTAERRQWTRLLNKAMNAAMVGTTGSEDPLFRTRWAALHNMD